MVSGLQRMKARNVVVVANKLEHWLKFTALFARPRTSGVESTAGRWIGWTGYLTGKDNATDPSLRVRDWRCRYQGLGIGMTRCVKYLLWPSHLHYLTQVHHSDIIADTLGNQKLMGDVEISKAKLIFEVLQKVKNLSLDRDVQSRGRFVKGDKLRLRSQGTSDGDALALTAAICQEIALADHTSDAGQNVLAHFFSMFSHLPCYNMRRYKTH